MLIKYFKCTELQSFSKISGVRYLNKLTDYSDLNLRVNFTTSDSENKFAEYKWVYYVLY